MLYTITMSGCDQRYAVIQATCIQKRDIKSFRGAVKELFLETILHMNKANWSFSPPILRPIGFEESTILDQRVELPIGSVSFSCKVYDKDRERAQQTLDRIRCFHEQLLSIKFD